MNSRVGAFGVGAPTFRCLRGRGSDRGWWTRCAMLAALSATVASEDRCLVCGGPLRSGPAVYSGVTDFPGDTADSRGQTLTMAPVIGKGPFAWCPRCHITYRLPSPGRG